MTERRNEVLTLLRLEGLLFAGAGLYLFSQSGMSWWVFAVLILAPDLSFLGYFKSTAFGAHCYNAVHTYPSPVILWGILKVSNIEYADPLALIWIIHIGIDRLLGYGLKYPDAFRHTHLWSATEPEHIRDRQT